MSIIVGVVLWSGTWMQKHRRNLTIAVAKTERDVQQAERLAHGARIEHAVAEERERFAERYGPAIQLKIIHDTFTAGDVVLAEKMLSSLITSQGGLERRGFAWGHLRELLEPEVTLLRTPDRSRAPTFILVVRRDSRILAAGRSDGRVELWDLNQMRLWRTEAVSAPGASGAESQIYWVAFSPGDRLFAAAAGAGAGKKAVKVWDLKTGALVCTLPGAPEEFASRAGVLLKLSFTERSDYLVCIYNSTTPKSRYVFSWKLPEHGGEARFAAMMNQDDLPRYGKHVPFQRSSLARGDECPPWVSYAEEHLLMLDDGTSLAIKEEETGVSLCDSQIRIARVYGPLGVPVLTLHDLIPLTKDDIAWWSERAFNLSAAAGNRTRRVLGPHIAPNFSPDGRTLAYYERGLGAVLKDVATDRIVRADVRRPTWWITDQVHTPDGRYLVMAGFHPQIHVWHLKPREIAAHQKEVWSLAFSPDGSNLASGADDHTIKIWDMKSVRERTTLKGHESLVTAVAYSPR